MNTFAVDQVDIEVKNFCKSIQKLKSDQIGKVIAKGLAVLYQTKPKFPIDYLAKWLLNYSASQENENKIQQTLQEKENLKRQHQDELEKQRALEEQTEKEKLQDYQIDGDFKEKIINHTYHNELIVEEFPEFLEQRKALTGSYVGVLDFPFKEINDKEEGDEAHLNVDAPKVINYIGYSKSHKRIMQGKILAQEQGVTSEVFKEKEAVEPVEGQEEGAVAEKPNYVYVPDLVKEPKMYYFRLPKLGSYMAVPLVFKSCLIEKAFDTGLEERFKFKEEKEKLDQERKQKESEFETRLKELQESNEDTAALEADWETEKEGWQELNEPEFESIKKEYVICFDTMGKDREISPQDRIYLDSFAKLLAMSWEDCEKHLLSDDIDKQIAYLASLPSQPKELFEKYLAEEEQAAEEKASQFEEIKEKGGEQEYNYELECLKLEKVKEQLSDKQLQEQFFNLKEYRVFKSPVILQNILYLLGHKREEINIPNTHILNWKYVKTLINEEFFEKLLEYNHRGQKNHEVQIYSKVNRISQKIEKVDQEGVEQYNLCYGRLFRWLKFTAALRKQDIEIRRIKVEKKKVERETKIQDNEKISSEKETGLEARKAELTEEEAATFSQEEWEKQYDQAHPLHDIGEEIQDDEDLDCEFD